MHASKVWAMRAGDDTVVGLMTENDESVCWKELKNFVERDVETTISPFMLGKLQSRLLGGLVEEPVVAHSSSLNFAITVSREPTMAY